MRKIMSLILIYTVLAVSCVSTTGCNANQVAQDIANIESKLPEIAALATGVLSLVAPEYVPFVAPATSAIKADGDLIQKLIADYKSSPSDTTLQRINAVVADGLSNIQAVVQAIDVKNPAEAGKIQAWAGLIGLIFQDAANFVLNNATPKQVGLLPAMFGWHIAGVDLVAVDGKPLPPPTKQQHRDSGFTARDIAKNWNRLCGKEHPQAKINVPKMHVLGIPVPFTGGKK